MVQLNSMRLTTRPDTPAHTACPHQAPSLARARVKVIPVCPLTSKTSTVGGRARLPPLRSFSCRANLAYTQHKDVKMQHTMTQVAAWPLYHSSQRKYLGSASESRPAPLLAYSIFMSLSGVFLVRPNFGNPGVPGCCHPSCLQQKCSRTSETKQGVGQTVRAC
jgi:hypothetical protein